MALVHEHATDTHGPRLAFRSGRRYRVDSPAANAVVTRELAQELERVLEQFAADAGASEARPIGVFFCPGIFGHHRVGRAADIYAVGGVGLDAWKARWDESMARAAGARDGAQRTAILRDARQRNLGWRLYKALQCYGRWSQPYGYPIQLFGPWTRSEGPWKCISAFLLRAHRDHIHLAK
jgi:hypothetical protein